MSDVKSDSDEPVYSVRCNVNGDDVSLTASATDTLLDVLRDQLHLYSVREGCGVGVCGSCTVLINGELRSACLTLCAGQGGATILTTEGLGDQRTLSEVQSGFLKRNAFQCSFCTPGFIITTERLLNSPSKAADEDWKEEYYNGNLCRCGCYEAIFDAIQDLQETPTGSAPFKQDATNV